MLCTLCSAGVKTTPLTLEVHKRKDILVDVSDRGFTTHVIRIDEGNAVMWKWQSCAIPHTITEAKYSLSGRGLSTVRETGKKAIATRSGTFRQNFE